MVRVAPTATVLEDHGANAPGVPQHRNVGPLGSAGVEPVRLMLAGAQPTHRPGEEGRAVGSTVPWVAIR